MTRYTGGCQCGAVRYEVECSLDQPVTCNCSRCSRLGWIMCFASMEDFSLRSGADRLSVYTFNREIVRHQFCSVCGIEPFARGVPPGRDEEMIAVNVRCLDGIDLDRLEPRKVDGKSL